VDFADGASACWARGDEGDRLRLERVTHVDDGKPSLNMSADEGVAFSRR